MVQIVQGPFGERLQITNYYAWLQTVFLRDYFVEVSEEAGRRLGEPFTLFQRTLNT